MLVWKDTAHGSHIELNHLRIIIDKLMENNALMHINAHLDQILSDSKSVLTYSEDPTEPPF